MVLNIPLNLTLDFTSLDTWAKCDKATEEVTFERKSFTVRDASIDLADERADRSQASGIAALAKKDGEILSTQNLLATAGLTPEARQDTADELELLQAQRKQIVKRNRQTSGTASFLADVDAGQVESQVAVLTAVLDGIATQRATLSA
ncbi:hypothetical protein [Hymenobacter terrenus]|uniref:hypothetical protein n=1 Tax=Hymenobacter terrenus TaxID=1629124 RepID=UPI00061987B8|nr:hypothetical protein [Hymenobacter terrenus]